MKNEKFFIHPIFLVIAAIVVYFGNAFLFLSYLLVVVLHELAHYFVAKSLGYKLNNICLMPYGAQLNLQSSILKTKDEILIAIAGPLFNLILFLLFLALWWLFPVIYVYTEYFVYANFITAVFNLLPLVPLDGSRIVLALFGIKNNRDKGYKVLSMINCVVAIFLVVLFIISAFYNINFTFGVIAIFLVVGAFEKEEAYKYSFLLSYYKYDLMCKRPLKVKTYIVLDNYDTYKLVKLFNPNYYTMIYVMDNNHKIVRVLTEKNLNALIGK